MAEAVLVLEDDARLAAFLDRGLAQAGYRPARSGVPDVIVAGGMDKLQIAREVAGVPVLLLTTNDCVTERIRGLDAGADDVLAKPFHFEELLARIRALSRCRSLSRVEQRKGALRYADLELDQDRRDVTRAGQRRAMRNRAFELLAYFLRNPERVLSRQELLQHVWGWDPGDDSNVIEVTISHLRQALEAHGEPRLIHTVRPVGYILKLSDDPSADRAHPGDRRPRTRS
jgi:two-component system, OmpR family, response regulator MprA